MIAVIVDYERKEYLQFLNQYLAQDARAKNTYDRWYNQALIWLIASIQFKYKYFRVGICSFEIDQESIRRSSKMGLLEKNWDDVETIIDLENFYCIKTTRGSIPLPKRVLDDEGMSLFVQYAGTLLVPKGQVQ